MIPATTWSAQLQHCFHNNRSKYRKHILFAQQTKLFYWAQHKVLLDKALSNRLHRDGCETCHLVALEIINLQQLPYSPPTDPILHRAVVPSMELPLPRLPPTSPHSSIPDPPFHDCVFLWSELAISSEQVIQHRKIPPLSTR
jgi:hypothetical protein